MVVRRAGLYALGIVTSVAVGAGGARLLWPSAPVPATAGVFDGDAPLVDPANATLAEAAVTAPTADVELDDATDPQPEPPPDRSEAAGPPPSDHHEWLNGYWDWSDEDDDYAWVGGVWYDRAAVAPYAPPRARHERIRRAPSSSFVFTPGYWRWGGQRYAWVGGHYARRHAGYRYVSPRWVKAHGRWEWRTGAWVSEREIALAREHLARLLANRSAAHPHREGSERQPAPIRRAVAAAAPGSERVEIDSSAVAAHRVQPTARADAFEPEAGGDEPDGVEAERGREEARLRALEDAEARNQAVREARQIAQRDARAREIATRDAQTRESEARHAEAREAATRDAQARQVAQREADARRAEARRAAREEREARLADARELAEREQTARAVEAGEEAVRAFAAAGAAAGAATQQEPRQDHAPHQGHGATQSSPREHLQAPESAKPKAEPHEAPKPRAIARPGKS